MAQPLDLQEQEQLDALKSFWKSYGNLITWALIAALAVYAGLNGWKWWQRDQSAKAAAMFDQLELAAQGGDAQRAGQIFSDLKERYPRTVFAEQAGLAGRARAVRSRPGRCGQGQPRLGGRQRQRRRIQDRGAPAPGRLAAAGQGLRWRAQAARRRQGADLRSPGRRSPWRCAAGARQEPPRRAAPTRRPGRRWTRRSSTGA